MDCKLYALPILGRAAPNEATLGPESRAQQRLAAGPYNAIATPVLMAGPKIVLGIGVR